MTPALLVLPWIQLALAQTGLAPDDVSSDAVVEAGASTEPLADEPPPVEHHSTTPEPAPRPESESTPPAEVTPAKPDHDAREHLARAQDLKASGDLASAEAEVSVAISIDPEDGAAYLERAQIRMGLADQIIENDTPTAQRVRAALLRDAADDVDGYLARTQLPSDGETWFRARQLSLRREADALDPPAPVIAPLPPRPVPQIPAFTPETANESLRDIDHSRRSKKLWTSGMVMSAGAVGLASASLRIARSCGTDELCSVRWQIRPALFAPAAALAALGTTSVILGVLDAPGLDTRRVRRATTATTLALGATATVLGTVTAAIAGARWYGPASPSDDAGLRTTMSLGNTSLASFTAALPLLSAGITAGLSARRKNAKGRTVGRGIRRGSRRLANRAASSH